MIDGSTQLYGLLGHPIAHSLSPAIYNGFFTAAGLNKLYVPLPVAPEALETVFPALRPLGFLGLNVTSPYKQRVAALVDRLEGVAAELGCVNTVRLEGDRWVGLNTDGEGLCRWLELAERLELGRLRVVLLGAGNAARAVFRALLDRSPRSLTVINRSSGRFREPFFATRAGAAGVTYLGLDSLCADEPMKDADLVVNATSYGLGGRQEGELSGLPSLALLGPRTRVVDTNYSPAGPTRFLAAVPAGCNAHDGRGMLLFLAREAYRAWTGRDPELEPVMRLLGLVPSP
jgi:shikimate dehydrogenase